MKGNKGLAEIFYIINIIKLIAEILYIINIIKLKSYVTNTPFPLLKRKIKFFKIYNSDNNEEFKSVN